MCDVKPDPDNPGICRGCLSTNRTLSTVASMDLYSLLREDQKVEALSIPHMALCWECRALLQRTRRFLVQVQRAHDILQDSLQLSPTKATLSLLTFHKKIEYDAVFEESIPPEQPLFSEPKNLAINYEKVNIPSKYKAEIPANNEQDGKTECFSDDNEDYDNDEGNFSRSECKIEIEVINDSLPLINKEQQKYVTLKNDAKQDTRETMHVKRKVENNKAKPRTLNRVRNSNLLLIESPAMLNVELELQKHMQLTAVALKVPLKELKNKCLEKTTVNDGNNYTNAANNECTTTTKHQKRTELEDPDFTLEENDEEFKGVPLKKTKRQSDENPNSDVEDVNDNDNTMGKTRKFKKTTTRYKNIADVFPYFTKIEMSQQDLKKVLDEDDAILDETRPYKCNLCGKNFTKVGHIKKHALRNHEKEYPNNFKKRCFQNPPLVMPEKFVWQCHICNRMMREDHVVEHMNDYHSLQFSCNIDGCKWWKDHFCFREKVDFDQHYKSIHKKHICDLCQKSKKNKMLLATHIQKAHVAKPTSFKCRFCPKVYNQHRSCQQHELSTHGPPEPEELRYCVECNITFKTIVTFKKHCNNLHSGVPRPTWTCEKCRKVLFTKETYLTHLDHIHGGGQSKHRCHICGKSYPKKYLLKTHLDRHNNIPIPKNKVCLICGKRFHTNKSLRFHTYTHTGERPYQCPHCEVAYNQPQCLVSHLKKTHDIVASVRVNGTIIPASATSVSLP